MKELIIRKARLKDVPAITGYGIELLLYHQKFDPYFAPVKDIKQVYSNYFKRCIYSRKNHLLVAEIYGEIIGYALGALSSRPPVFKLRTIGVINDMFIIEKFRKQGIAELFLDKLYLWFKKHKLSYLELSVHTRNEIGKKAWAKYGFKDYLIKLRNKI